MKNPRGLTVGLVKEGVVGSFPVGSPLSFNEARPFPLM